MLPGLDGLEVMRRLRELGDTGPRERVAVILLTAKGEESDRVIGLRQGADDYVVKPFSPAELVARVDAVLRRVDPAPDKAPPIVHGDVDDRPGRAARVRRAARRSCSPSASSTCCCSSPATPGQAFTRNQLMDAVWQYTFYSDTSTVTVHVRRLRAKIEQDPARPRHVQTVWGVGYRFQP